LLLLLDVEENLLFDDFSPVGENRRVRQWACGAAGSALPWHGRGRRFDPDQVHHLNPPRIKHFQTICAKRTKIVQTAPEWSRMLSVYTRHYPPCTHTDINHRRCRCPKWVQGTLPDGHSVRISARTRSWERAEIEARKIEDIADPHKPAVRPRVTILDAIQCSRDDEKSRHLSKHTQKKSEFFLEKQLKTWAVRLGLEYLNQLSPAELTKFRSAWGNGSSTTRRKHERHERLVAFFWFCVRMDWIDKNPAVAMKRVKAESKPTDYFTQPEFDRAQTASNRAFGTSLRLRAAGDRATAA
jgi:hypothetical protein